jgi:hypothetical protein
MAPSMMPVSVQSVDLQRGHCNVLGEATVSDIKRPDRQTHLMPSSS